MAGIAHLDSARLLERCLGNTALALQMLQLFREHVPPVADRLVLAAEQSNWPEAERYAHRLKGSVGNICADKLSKLAAESEQAARSKSDTLLKLTHETRQAIAECVGEIDVLLESMA